MCLVFVSFHFVRFVSSMVLVVSMILVCMNLAVSMIFVVVVFDVLTAPLKVGRFLCFDRTLGGWALFLLLFFLETGCPTVFVFPGVSSPKGSWGRGDNAARASGCQPEIYKRCWAIRQSLPTILYDR